MYKYTAGIIILLIAINQVQCGIYGRDYLEQLHKGDNKYASYNGVGAQNGRSTSEHLQHNNNSKPTYTRSGMSAWTIIALILLVILLGMGAYYGMLCYPIICKHERMYDIMDAGSTSSGTPTRSTEFEKMGNYSSRSTTPSKSND
ncbi:hypothetical protein HA402_004407 [Bradysia odoriphaga]|nr:hypothetical protein HA402_004407 [Bradysia odoriphaga]